MRNIKAVITLVGILVVHLLWASTVLADEVREVQWQDLIPSHLRAADPLAQLSEEDRGLINWVIYMQETMPKEISPEDREVIEELNMEITNLKKRGFDLEKIVAWRRDYNSAVAPELDGTKIRLSGYLLPLEMSGESVKEFLLVPFVGACIHVPPPPPNQIIHVTMAGESGYSSERIFEPVSVTGLMSSKAMTKDLYLADGSSDVNIGYTMQAEDVQQHRK